MYKSITFLGQPVVTSKVERRSFLDWQRSVKLSFKVNPFSTAVMVDVPSGNITRRKLLLQCVWSPSHSFKKEKMETTNLRIMTKINTKRTKNKPKHWQTIVYNAIQNHVAKFKRNFILHVFASYFCKSFSSH